jgi:hypothetical protein
MARTMLSMAGLFLGARQKLRPDRPDEAFPRPAIPTLLLLPAGPEKKWFPVPFFLFQTDTLSVFEINCRIINISHNPT